LDGSCYILFENLLVPKSVRDFFKADIYIFIVRFDVEAWFECLVASKAAINDLNFVRNLKIYENEDLNIHRVRIVPSLPTTPAYPLGKMPIKAHKIEHIK
jgi:hypothetical protein